MELSFWEKEFYYQPNQIVIVGAGIVGLSTAIYLKEKNPDSSILILEKGIESSGASTKNGGFACFGSVTEILDDLNSMPEKEVIALIRNRYNGLKRLLRLVGKESIGYKNLGGYEVFTLDEDVVNEEGIKLANELASQATELPNIYSKVNNQFGIKCAGPLIYNPYEGQLNPMLLIHNLKRKAYRSGIRILYNTKVSAIKVEENYVQVNDSARIPFTEIAICTNGFARILFPDLKVKPARNIVLMTAPIPDLKIRGTFHCDKGYVYFRNYGNRILLGGARNQDVENEYTSELGLNKKVQNYLTEFLNTVLFPKEHVRIDHWWSGIMGVGATKETIVEKYKGVFMGVRLGGMGVALGSEIGNQLADLIMGDQ